MTGYCGSLFEASAPPIGGDEATRPKRVKGAFSARRRAGVPISAAPGWEPSQNDASDAVCFLCSEQEARTRCNQIISHPSWEFKGIV